MAIQEMAVQEIAKISGGLTYSEWGDPVADGGFVAADYSSLPSACSLGNLAGYATTGFFIGLLGGPGPAVFGGAIGAFGASVGCAVDIYTGSA